MEKWIARIGLGVGAIALVMVVVQQGTIGELESRLKTAEAASPAEVATGETVAVESYDDAALSARIAALEKTVSQQREMQRAVSRAASSGRPRVAAALPKTVTGEAKGEVADEVTSLREDVDALLTGAGVQSDEGKKEIAGLVRKVQQQERQARDARRSEFRKKADAEFITSFAESEGLADETATAMTKVMSDMRDAQMKLRTQMRDGSLPFEEGRAQRRALRDSSRKAIGEVLTEEQAESFTKKMAERRGGRGGRGR